eukprot:CAMPEP_0170382586 /NCGR_PEP_ID=MMETSP0117_2-20130122/15027_1 /TAXON_ID=400756 /ORGANISM="Durinskia baltica, Strain CSIRO CS-38" /LENGTH=71 /DNA_ID=CAMNT_0010638245 /DNA_START=70 /DNA_END=285 /DNA_ORIENTATION=+
MPACLKAAWPKKSASSGRLGEARRERVDVFVRVERCPRMVPAPRLGTSLVADEGKISDFCDVQLAHAHLKV